MLFKILNKVIACSLVKSINKVCCDKINDLKLNPAPAYKKFGIEFGLY